MGDKQIQSITLEEYQAAIKTQGHKKIEDTTFRCPRCNTAQSAQDLINAGAGKSFEEVEGYLGFSCVGKWSETKGCNWTLGGLL